MKIANNFDARKIASAKNRILFAVAFLCMAALLFWSPSLRVFAAKHPGIIGVLVAVTGEVYFDWVEEIGKHARWKKFFMALLVVSLSYELYEASETDKEAAGAIKLAGEANKKAESERVRADVLEANIRELAHVYGQSSNALVEATNILDQAKGQLAIAQIKLAETNSRLAAIRPIKDRLTDLFNELDARIMPALRSGMTRFTGRIPEYQYTRLKSLQAEKGAGEFISMVVNLNGSKHNVFLGSGGSEFEVQIDLKPALAQ